MTRSCTRAWKPVFSDDELKSLLLPKKLQAWEVAEQLRFSSKSNVLTEVDLSLTPYLLEPLSLIGKTSTSRVMIVACTQSGKTLFLQTVVAYTISQSPGTLMYILPDQTTGRKALRDRVIDVIENTPILNEHVIHERDLSMTAVILDNMTILPAWAGSPPTMNGTPCKVVVWDECRLFPYTVGNESNAIKLGEDRLTTFEGFGLGQGFMVSSPSTEGDLFDLQVNKIGTKFLHRHFACPHCNKYQLPDFFLNILVNVDVNFELGTWKLKEGRTGVCTCQHCRLPLDDSGYKKDLNSTGLYAEKGQIIPNYDTKTGKPNLNIDYGQRVTFRWCSMVSPFRSFVRILEEYIMTKPKLHDYKNFWQAWLALPWVDDLSKHDEDTLKKRIDDSLPRGLVPSWTKILTGGVDTQDDGFYVTIRAHGARRRTHLVDDYFISSKMSMSTVDTLAPILERDIEKRIYLGEDGENWSIAICALDSGGHRTKQVYEAVNRVKRFIKVKGRNNQDITIKHNNTIGLYLVRTCEYLDETEQLMGADYYTLHKDVDSNFLKQYTSVRLIRRVSKLTGITKAEWVKSKDRNCDYRFADIHNFICLDVESSLGVLRRRIDEPDFKYNPLQIVQVSDAVLKRVVTDDGDVVDFEDTTNEYDVGTIDW